MDQYSYWELVLEDRPVCCLDMTNLKLVVLSPQEKLRATLQASNYKQMKDYINKEYAEVIDLQKDAKMLSMSSDE